MDEVLDRQFLNYSATKMQKLASRIETCLGKLTEDQVWARGHESENAVGNLVLHLCGNVRQWIIAGVGSKPDVRDRDSEFNARGGIAIPELARRLRETVEEAAAVIGAVQHHRLPERLSIQKYDVSVLEAIYHVVEHFSMHAGQIMFVTKMVTGEDLGFFRHLRSTAADQKSA